MSVHRTNTHLIINKFVYHYFSAAVEEHRNILYSHFFAGRSHKISSSNVSGLKHFDFMGISRT